MQHAARLDDIEAAADRAELEDVRLGVFDIGQAELARLPLGVTQAGQAEVDGEHSCAREAPRALDPARIRHFLVLAPDLERNLVVDRSERRDGVPNLPFLQRLPYLLVEQGGYWLRPRPFRERLRVLERVERDVGRDGN